MLRRLGGTVSGITASIALLAFFAAAAHAQGPRFIRGTVTGLEGNTLSVKARDGRDLKVTLADNFGVSTTKAVTLADIKPGDYVGVAAKKGANDTLTAVEVQLFPAALRRVVREGHFPWPMEPGATMTNATLSAVVQAAGGREMTLAYKGGSQKIVVPEGVPMFTTVPADRSLLVPGADVFFGAQVAPDGKMSAARVRVNKEGVKKP